MDTKARMAKVGRAGANSAGAPLYRQAKRELQRLIECGHYGPGATLPSETGLARALGVSIGTLRRAVDELVHEHLLVRRQGRGTYVTSHTAERFLFQFFHVELRPDAPLDAPGEREYPQVTLVDFTRGKADEMEAAALDRPAGDAVFRIDNRLSLAGRAVVHDRITVAAALFKNLTEQHLRARPGTLYSLYQSEFGITVLRARERVRAIAADTDAARILGLPRGQPVLQVHRIALSFGDKPVEYRVSTVHTAMHDYVSLLPQGR
ncbi:GntR family transcriptional regulator [Ramlibacter sp.]|uniref:GntR family transcriptional regulator n=1 Tax=Ramlibacter sp. TaxID=1917967 RepID=UPI0017BE13D8|nr:GntR family transcriptional regulator [Ramlibacter sp.]MBA2673823.1 GntR family transcriptional regulator [Ramlibacter sp.]